MMDVPGARGMTPATVLRETPPPEDSGAETADRYEWQAMMATADVISLYFAKLDDAGNLVEGADFTVICEHHEDWAVDADAQSEIVSAKHREASVGPLNTYRQILNEGGVLHLFDRWQKLGMTPLCRLVTSAGLSGDAARTARACERLRQDLSTEDSEVLDVVRGLGQVVVGSATGINPVPERDDLLRAFLACLRFQDSQPQRKHLPDMAAERFGRPVAQRLGNGEAAAAIWQAVLALVRPRMRAAGPSTGGALPTVMGTVHDNSLAARTLTCDDVDTAVRFALRNVAGYAPLPRMIKANRMAVKMAHGGCSDNAIERADSLRRQYGQYWRIRRSSPGLSDQRLRLTNTLSRVVDEATHSVRADDRTWGAELWRELDDRFRVLEGQRDAQGLDAYLLLGGVSELANQCKAWYSDRFDAHEALRQLVTQETAL